MQDMANRPPRLGAEEGGGARQAQARARASSPIEKVYNPMMSPSITPSSRRGDASSPTSPEGKRVGVKPPQGAWTLETPASPTTVR